MQRFYKGKLVFSSRIINFIKKTKILKKIIKIKININLYHYTYILYNVYFRSRGVIEYFRISKKKSRLPDQKIKCIKKHEEYICMTKCAELISL